MCDDKKGAFPSPSSDKFSLWELGILGSPHYFKWGLRSENMSSDWIESNVYIYTSLERISMKAIS
jgi:hypothetical protein